MVVGHLPKEASRIVFKSTGLFTVMPWLNAHYEPGDAQLLFAGGMSALEMFINPVDKTRVDRQSGQPIKMSFNELYKGSLGNGARQFGTWYLFGQSNRMLNAALTEHTSIDPHSYTALLVKALPQSIAFTSVVFPLERIKNEMQFDGKSGDNRIQPRTAVEVGGNWLEFIKGNERLRSSYVEAAKQIIKEYGVKELYRGAGAKTLSNAVLAWGATLLVELGNQNQHAKSR